MNRDYPLCKHRLRDNLWCSPLNRNCISLSVFNELFSITIYIYE